MEIHLFRCILLTSRHSNLCALGNSIGQGGGWGLGSAWMCKGNSILIAGVKIAELKTQRNTLPHTKCNYLTIIHIPHSRGTQRNMNMNCNLEKTGTVLTRNTNAMLTVLSLIPSPSIHGYFIKVSVGLKGHCKQENSYQGKFVHKLHFQF